MPYLQTSLGRRLLLTITLSCWAFTGCTALRDPNQWFGAGAPGASGAAASGASGVSGNDLGGTPSAAGNSAGSGGKTVSETLPQTSSGAGGTSCEDSDGFDGLGCYSCPPLDIVSLENACSPVTCTRFDEALRLSRLDETGAPPPLPSFGGSGGQASGPEGGASAAGAAPTAGAGSGIPCATLAGEGRVVYVAGSSAAKPFLQQIAQQLVARQVFIVYTATGSCAGVDAVVNGTPLASGPSGQATSATYWDSSASSGVACDLPSKGVSADIGVSDVFAQSCAGFELSNLDALQVRDAHGPIQTMTFAVPANSTHSEISARAAYFVFGFGKDGGVRDETGSVAIWNDEALLFQRSPTSGTQALLSAAIGVPAVAWRGKGHKTSDEVAAAIQAAGQTEDTASAALGILAADYIESKNLRAQIRVLAFQDSAQACAVYPDSTSHAHDKRNVRDGHYPLWGPLHLLLRVDAQGAPLNPATRQAVSDIVGYLSGTKALPNGVQLIDVYAQSGLVPECAMRVTRTKDGGNIVPYQPTSPCACLFEMKATGSTNCTRCLVQGDCATGETCSQGYCEP